MLILSRSINKHGRHKQFLFLIGWWYCLLTNRDEMSNLYRKPSIEAFYQISVHLGKWFQRRTFFRNQPIRNKNGLWRPCLLTDRDKKSNLYRGPSIDASYQVSVHLAMPFQRRRFKKIDPNELKFGRKLLWKVFYKDCSFRPDSLTNSTTAGNSCFYLVDF
jgi:hypothetical protein